MDPSEERRHSKKQKEYCDMLGLVEDSQYGIPRRCACHPWVVGVQEEMERLRKRLEEAEEVIKGVWSLNYQIESLQEQVRSLTVQVGTLEKVCFD
ncbi:hypothetical protein Bca52824_042642 [Brassica carinata]|uniref:Uncharacterized protein n=1 Tax=Brassica carinata TaxID=52824 RepID=A0A8X7RV60_BRACI|nr:hypothetical protein Bca52824_042642 [Brassica carinata]